MVKVVELTEDNEDMYLDQVASLEEDVLQKMEQEGRIGQLFITGKEDISEYVHSKENTVLVALDKDEQVQAATYITQGQKPFTYNDITKYFKYGENYKQYVKSLYPNKQDYMHAMMDIYKIKLQAFEYAKVKVLSEYPQVKSIGEFLNQELDENGFHEKSELREKVNKYMSEYIMLNFDSETLSKYEQFYWCTAEDIANEFGKEPNKSSEKVQEYEQFMQYQAEYEQTPLEYEKILHEGGLKIHEKPDFNEEKYYSANTENAIELDTYITSSASRSAGLARIIVYEGIKKHMNRHFMNSQSPEIFLCSTLHRDNLSSKYVSEFFGLTDSLFVNRRQGRDREVHICRIGREQWREYLLKLSDKLAVLYGYNPNQKHISETTTKEILEEQLAYEQAEHDRLTKARTSDKNFKGINHKFIGSKESKIRALKQKLEEVNAQIKKQDAQL